MCPLRIILIFLSASLAAFLAWKNFQSAPSIEGLNGEDKQPQGSTCGRLSKVFWACVDMASGKYLWRNLAPGKSELRTS
ncbi:hypothetical protein AMTRI_Chr08g167710 [Amborella trichopoda]